MRHVTAFRRGALLTGVVGALACHAGSAGLSDADAAAVRALTQQFAQAIVAHDFDRAVALRTDDVAWMPPNAPTVTGKAALRQALEAAPRAVRFEVHSQWTEGSGRIAYDRGTYVYAGTVGSDTLTERGKYVEIFRRQLDGSWLIALDMFSSDEPASSPAPIPPPKR